MRVKRIISALMGMFAVIALCASLHVQAESGGVLLVYHTQQQCDNLSALIYANGLPLMSVPDTEYQDGMAKDYDYLVTTSEKPLSDASYPVLCVGDGFSSTDEITFEHVDKTSVSVSYGEYLQPAHYEEQITVITANKGKIFAKLELSMGRSYPFAAIGKNKTYVPYYRADDLTALALGAAMKDYFGEKSDGTMYVVVDEIYPFSNLEMLCSTADRLYENAIPFVVRIVPEYDNLDYPAFLRYVQVLRYVQSRNGSIVLHDPIVKEEALELETLADKMKRFHAALEENDVEWMDMSLPPYAVSLATIENIQSNTKNFGSLPFDTMIVTSLPKTDKELDQLVVSINQKWLSIGDYKRKFTNENFQYSEVPVDSEHIYFEEEQQSLVKFFLDANQLLVFIVGAILVLFIILMIIGYRLYRKKFY